MKVEQTAIEVQGAFLTKYMNDETMRHRFFEYDQSEEHYKQRIEEVQKRTYQYDSLYTIIQKTMERTDGESEATNRHLEEIRAQEALFVVGGQQAGIFTGPLYTVHKAVTAIVRAKQLREQYGIKAVPLFWVAGEDHDIEEVNHFYVPLRGKAHKVNGEHFIQDRQMVSTVIYDQEKMKELLHYLFRTFEETAYTKSLFATVERALTSSTTYTQFFLKLMNTLFKEEGLLYIDAADPLFKEIQSDAYVCMIENERMINRLVREKEQLFFEEEGRYPIQLQEENANLFYVEHDERFLIEWKNGRYEADRNRWSGTKEDLIQLAKKSPERLSNNVVTRPLMQEAMLPTIEFVAGPGEIAYWALLKEAFVQLQFKMPIIVPRLSITICTRPVQVRMKQLGIEWGQVFRNELLELRRDYLKRYQNESFHTQLREIEHTLYEQYRQLEKVANTTEIKQLVRQNYTHHVRQLNYLKKREQLAVRRQHEATLKKFDDIAEQLYPGGSLQERFYSPYAYLNVYGPAFIRDLVQTNYTFDGKHQIVIL